MAWPMACVKLMIPWGGRVAAYRWSFISLFGAVGNFLVDKSQDIFGATYLRA